MKVALGIIWLGLIAAYLQITSFEGLTYDDPSFLEGHPAAGMSLFSANFWQTIASVPTANLWHPLTDLSHQLLLRVSKAAPLHLAFNVILHGLSASFLLHFLVRITKQNLFSLALVLLFAWHPITVESVAWISGRKDLLCTLFLILATGHYHDRISKDKPPLTLPLFLTAIAAYLCKPIAFTLPFLLLAIDYWPLRRTEPLLKLVLSKWPLWLLSSLSIFITIAVQAGGTQAVNDTRPLFIRLTEALWALQHGFTSCLLPKNLHLAYANPSKLSLYWILAWIFCGLLLSFLLLWKRKTIPSIGAGAFWFLCTIGPTLGILRAGNHLAADRYCYLPLIGIIIALAGSGSFFLKLRPRTTLFFLFTLSCGLLFATSKQISHWKNQHALFSNVLRHDSQNLPAHIELAQIALKSGDQTTMNHHLDEALRVTPNSPSAHIILAHLAFEASDYATAYEHYLIASQTRTRETWLQERLAASAYRNNELTKTRIHMEAAFQLARPTDRHLKLEKKWRQLFPNTAPPQRSKH